MRNLSATLLATVLASGCSLLYGTDDFVGNDAGGQTDAGHVDAGSMDAGSMDSGSEDAGPRDAGHDAGCVEMCGEVCTDTDHDPLHCGSCGNACPAPPDNAAATCSEGSCGFTCNPGFDLVVGSCAARPAPRPIAPLSTATATSKRPTFRWELAPRNDGARVEICADRACTTVITTIDATGDHARPTADLPTGVVFWRLYGRLGDDVGPEYSPTWQLYIRARSAPVDTSWGTVSDVNGDGFADVLRSIDGEIHVHHGGPSGISPIPTTRISAPADAGPKFGLSFSSAGDVNGDGFSDVIVGAPDSGDDTGNAYVYHGSHGGLESTPARTLVLRSSSDTSFGTFVHGLGDTNADGYSDVAVYWNARVRVYHGTPLGTSDVASYGPSSTTVPYSKAIAACDVNGDGFQDVLIGNSAIPVDSIGSVRLHLGAAEGTAPSPVVTFVGPDGPGSFFGSAVDCGDLNGDGYGDLVMGTASATGNERVFVYLGNSGVLDDTLSFFIETDGDATHTFGATLAVNDLDGDGYADIAVGAHLEDRGAVRVYLGADGSTVPMLSVTRSAPVGTQSFGVVIRSIGDVNADGFADLIVHSEAIGNSIRHQNVYFGAPGGLSVSPAITLDIE